MNQIIQKRTIIKRFLDFKLIRFFNIYKRNLLKNIVSYQIRLFMISYEYISLYNHIFLKYRYMDKVCPIYSIYCKHCSTLLTNRGMSVYLVSTPTIKLYSTDLITNKIQQSQKINKFIYCQCKIRDTFCKQCKTVIGYHVIQPCEICKSDNNSHYWLFNNCDGKLIQDAFWQDIPSLIKFEGEIILPIQQIEQQYICPICLSIFDNPVIINCGHTFCEICIRRQIDLRKKCPLDNLQFKSDEKFIKNRVIQSLIEKIQIQCKNNCCLINSNNER